MGKDLRFILSVAKYISSQGRFPGEIHHGEVRQFLKESLEEFGNLQTQRFEASLLKPLKGKVQQGILTFEGLPYTNSPSGEVWGELTYIGYGIPRENLYRVLKDRVVLLKEGKLPFRKKEEFLLRKGVKGVIVYREEVDEIYSGVSAGLLPVVSVKASDARRLRDGETVFLQAQTQALKVEGENLYLEMGAPAGGTLNLIAHYDTKPNTPGAIDNALSVSLLLWLLGKLSTAGFSPPYRLRFLFTDMEEYGLLGAKHFVNSLPEVELKQSAAVSVDTVGWRTPAVLVRDGDGFNSLKLLRLCGEMLKELGMEGKIAFTEGKSGRSDHIPFRQKGAKTLFFASNPFPYRHTPLDTYDIIDPQAVKLWSSFLSFFVKNFPPEFF